MNPKTFARAVPLPFMLATALATHGKAPVPVAAQSASSIVVPTAGNVRDLLVAIRRGDTSALKSALASKVDPDTKDDTGATALMYAAAYASATEVSPAARPVAGFAVSRIAAQADPSQTVAERPTNADRTPRARPDISGFWLNDTATPLERPEAFAEHAFFTDAQAREYEQHYLDDRARALMGGVEDRTNADILEPGHVLPDRRTSLIVDPPTGKVPTLTADAQKRNAARAQDRRAHPTDGPEDLPLPARCLIFGGGPPMMPVFNNNNVFILQTESYVVILNEMIHDARVVPLDGRPHLPANIRQWRGDPRGHWDDQTLVVETTNFTDRTAFRGSGDGLRVVERFRRIDANTLQYEFTIDDPSSFTARWSASSVMTKTNGPICEYACHEGNYSLVNMLKAARYQEQAR